MLLSQEVPEDSTDQSIRPRSLALPRVLCYITGTLQEKTHECELSRDGYVLSSASMTYVSFDGWACLRAAGSRAGEGGHLLHGQEASHVAGVVWQWKAPGATGGLTQVDCGDAGGWRGAGGVVITAAHSAGGSAAWGVS